MKNVILFLVLTIVFSSCNSVLNERKKSKIEVAYVNADMYLEYDARKIGLISIINNVPHKQANSVLRDYLAKVVYNDSIISWASPDYIIKVVDTIAQKNNLSKKLTASLIFSYQYEMITREDIIEEKMNELEEDEYYEEVERY